jgi:ketosteroid isomerase-like protein
MSELDDFLTQTLARQVKAEEAIHNGDLAPRLAMWTRNDPVSLFGGMGPCNSGWPDVSRTFHWLARRFSDCTSYEFELMAAGLSGDLAYTVGYEHTATSIDGEPQTYTLRVTHVYRREAGTWKIVHRHGDYLAEDQSAPAQPAADGPD